MLVFILRSVSLINRADYTIDVFNLNEPSLVDRRKGLLSIDLNAYGEISLDQLRIYLKDYGFPSVLEQMYQKR